MHACMPVMSRRSGPACVQTIARQSRPGRGYYMLDRAVHGSNPSWPIFLFERMDASTKECMSTADRGPSMLLLLFCSPFHVWKQ
jgi:hypothetical protein